MPNPWRATQCSIVTEPLLVLRDVEKTFPIGRGVMDALRGLHAEQLRAVDGITLAINRGEALGLVGESGCGKSTVAWLIVGLHEASKGSIEFGGRKLQRKRSPAERRSIQMVFQDPRLSLNPSMRVGQVLTELLRVHHVVASDQVQQRVEELAELVGLSPSILEAYPRGLSGGQRQRVSIARSLAVEPDLLVADEPVSALDVSVQATILNLLSDLRARLGLTLLLISHDMAVVKQVCGRVAVMYLGRIAEIAPTTDLFSRPHHPYTQGLLRSIPRLEPGSHSRAVALPGDPPSPVLIPSGCRFRARCAIADSDCAKVDPSLEQVGKEHFVACLRYHER